MDINITYPKPSKIGLWRKKMLNIVRWPVLAAAIICPAVNICTGGKAWSAIVLISLYAVWTLVLSPALVEYNRISQVIKAVVLSCIILALIDILLVPGWAVEVIALVMLGGIIASSALFFSDLNRQKQNMFPLLFLLFISFAGSAAGLYIWRDSLKWQLIVLCAAAFTLLIACCVISGPDLTRELKRRLHTK